MTKNLGGITRKATVLLSEGWSRKTSVKMQGSFLCRCSLRRLLDIFMGVRQHPALILPVKLIKGTEKVAHESYRLEVMGAIAFERDGRNDNFFRFLSRQPDRDRV